MKLISLSNKRLKVLYVETKHVFLKVGNREQMISKLTLNCCSSQFNNIQLKNI